MDLTPLFLCGFVQLAGCDILTALIGINRRSAARRYKQCVGEHLIPPPIDVSIGWLYLPLLRAAPSSPRSLAGGFPFVGLFSTTGIGPRATLSDFLSCQRIGPEGCQMIPAGDLRDRSVAS